MYTQLRTLLKQSSALTSITAIAALLAGPVLANPLGGEVVAGTATITTPDPSTLLIDQYTDRAIINWDSFNIDAGETTRFVLPGADSWTLNRVIGSQSPSLIYGSIVSNGNIVIVNPDGMHFGAGSTVDVNRLIATTADIANGDFMAGQLSFGIAGNPSASIVNEGTISAADYGLAALVAPSVRNSGVITARLGTVGLSAGNTFTIDPYGDGLIKLAIGDEIAGDVYDVATGETVSDLVLNEGTLSADGGTVAMTAATARQAVNSVVNNTGIVEARSIGVQNGMIILGGSTAATKPVEAPAQVVQVSGTLDASGHDELYPLGVPVEGGDIQITGEVILAHDATIDASGDNGGGTILIGGDYLGGNIEAQEAVALGVQMEDEAIDTASLVVLDDTVRIIADSTEAGDGGKVIVWSDDTTLTAAEITARGGAASGDGGFIETSGKNYLSVLAAADASAANGQVGTWLMDPVDIRIVDGLEQYLTVLPNQFLGQLPVNGTLVEVYADFYVPVDQYDVIRIPCVTEDPGGCTPREVRIDRHSEASLIDAATIEAALNGGTAVFITNVNSLGDDPGSISIEADINKTAGGDAFLGFNAVDDIVIASGVDITSTSGRLMLSFASANGQIRGSNIGFIDTNGGITLLAAPEGANVSSAGFISNPGNPSALQIDIQNYPSSAGSYNLVSAGHGFLNFSYNSTTATFGQDAINLGGNPISLQIIMDHNAVLADGAITDTSGSQIVFLFMDPASTMTAAQPGNNVAEIASNGIIAAGSQAGVGGELNVLPVLEVAEGMDPVQQCAGITCVPVTTVVVPPVPPGLGDEVGQDVLDPDILDRLNGVGPNPEIFGEYVVSNPIAFGDEELLLLAERQNLLLDRYNFLTTDEMAELLLLLEEMMGRLEDAPKVVDSIITLGELTKWSKVLSYETMAAIAREPAINLAGFLLDIFKDDLIEAAFGPAFKGWPESIKTSAYYMADISFDMAIEAATNGNPYLYAATKLHEIKEALGEVVDANGSIAYANVEGANLAILGLQSGALDVDYVVNYAQDMSRLAEDYARDPSFGVGAIELTTARQVQIVSAMLTYSAYAETGDARAEDALGELRDMIDDFEQNPVSPLVPRNSTNFIRFANSIAPKILSPDVLSGLF